MSGTADQVFGFLADCVKEVDPLPGTKLGFTFSFPSEQTAINHSTLVIWTKGFSATGCVGLDSVELLEKALREMYSRGREVPGGACGFWGACGAGISAGMFISIVTGSTPLGKENFGLSHKMTASVLNAIGEIGGPRCCKRDSYLSILKAVDFVKENLGISMERPEIRCSFRSKNNQCVGKRCPFCK